MPRKKTPESVVQTEAFERWYANKRNFRSTAATVGVGLRTLYDWSERYDWEARAEARDAKARAVADTKAVQRTAKLLDDQAKAGALLRLRGVEFLSVKGRKLEDGRTAIAAIKTGIELERQVMGLPDYVHAIINATPEQLDTIVDDMERRRRAGLSDSEGEEG